MNLHRRGAACLLVLVISACSSSSDAPANPDGEQDLGDVIYVPNVTDEALERMLAITPKTDARQAVVVDSPDLSAPVSKDSPATLHFHLLGETTRAPALPFAPSHSAPSKWRRGFHELVQLLAPERIAHAHGEPYNGTAYYLVISDKDSKHLLQVFTPETSYTPEAADWKHLVEAPQPLTLEITSAYFEGNNVTADGGPFVGGKFQFRIE
ncbi:MAG TPA: hypothetical protein VHM25_17000 [Polyangiaceae bacterium]|nr:hypothetical protein [Polyangiaceae bacterium]